MYEIYKETASGAIKSYATKNEAKADINNNLRKIYPTEKIYVTYILPIDGAVDLDVDYDIVTAMT